MLKKTVILMLFAIGIPGSQWLQAAIQSPPAPAPSAQASPGPVDANKRRDIFNSLLQQTFQAQGIRPDGLLMIGTGSWMSTDEDKRKNSRDIDATISYIDSNQKQGGDFQTEFYRLKSIAEQTYGPLDITLFVDKKSEGEPDYYRGPTGQYFLYHHSNDNNPQSTFNLSPNGQEPLNTDQFWKARGLDVPNTIAQASLFVQDNQNFLSDHLNPPTQAPQGLATPLTDAQKAALIAKYVLRVDITLKEAISKEWLIDLPSVDPELTGTLDCISDIGKSYNIQNVDFESLDTLSNDQLDAGVRKCLGLGPGDDLAAAVEKLHTAANGYFTQTTKQVQDAEDSLTATPTPIETFVPEPTPSNTGPEPTPTNTSSGEPTPTNTSAEPAPTPTA